MLYDYQCGKCLKVREEWHGMTEHPVIVCMKCGGECYKLISVNPDNIFAANVPLYDFVDEKTTNKKIRFKSKTGWNEHLKRIGQVEAPNTPPSAMEIASAERTQRLVAKRELKAAVVAAVKDKKHIREVKQKYAAKIR